MKKRIVHGLLFCALLSVHGHSVGHPIQLELDFDISGFFRPLSLNLVGVSIDMSAFSRFVTVSGVMINDDPRALGLPITGSCYAAGTNAGGGLILSCILLESSVAEYLMTISFNQSLTRATGEITFIYSSGSTVSAAINATNITFQ